jgi:hypothetical protein
LEIATRYFCGCGQTQRVAAASATKASFKASITAPSSDSVAILTDESSLDYLYKE